MTALASAGRNPHRNRPGVREYQLQAATDELTGLDNRRTFERHLRRCWPRQNRPYALALADLDHFKRLNDKHGHEAGDRALRLFAQVAQMPSRPRPRRTLGRARSSTIILPDVDQAEALTVIERLRVRLAGAHSGNQPRFTASFGVTDSAQADTVQDLIKRADAALYAAKEAGRDQARNGARPLGVGDPASEADDVPRASSGPFTRPRPRPSGSFHHATVEDDPSPAGLELR